MKLVKHPYVVQLLEIGIVIGAKKSSNCVMPGDGASKTKIYIVLEYVTGGELFNKIVHHTRLKEDKSRKYFQQLIDAVDYCHSRNVYHRDLKV